MPQTIISSPAASVLVGESVQVARYFTAHAELQCAVSDLARRQKLAPAAHGLSARVLATPAGNCRRSACAWRANRATATRRNRCSGPCPTRRVAPMPAAKTKRARKKHSPVNVARDKPRTLDKAACRIPGTRHDSKKFNSATGAARPIPKKCSCPGRPGLRALVVRSNQSFSATTNGSLLPGKVVRPQTANFSHWTNRNSRSEAVVRYLRYHARIDARIRSICARYRDL